MAVKKTSDNKPAIKAPEPVKLQPQVAKQPQAAFFVYIGPDIRGVISKNAIYRKDELKGLDDAIKQHPDIKHLLIPGEQLGEARATIKKQDSFLAAVYNRLATKA